MQVKMTFGGRPDLGQLGRMVSPEGWTTYLKRRLIRGDCGKVIVPDPPVNSEGRGDYGMNALTTEIFSYHLWARYPHYRSKIRSQTLAGNAAKDERRRTVYIGPPPSHPTGPSPHTCFRGTFE